MAKNDRKLKDMLFLAFMLKWFAIMEANAQDSGGYD